MVDNMSSNIHLTDCLTMFVCTDPTSQWLSTTCFTSSCYLLHVSHHHALFTFLILDSGPLSDGSDHQPLYMWSQVNKGVPNNLILTGTCLGDVSVQNSFLSPVVRVQSPLSRHLCLVASLVGVFVEGGCKL